MENPIEVDLGVPPNQKGNLHMITTYYNPYIPLWTVPRCLNHQSFFYLRTTTDVETKAGVNFIDTHLAKFLQLVASKEDPYVAKVGF